jgi:L-fucose isomerase
MKTPSTRLGLLSFSDGRHRVHEGLKPGILEKEKPIREAIEDMGATVVPGEDVIFTPRMAVREAKRLLGFDVAALVFNIPVFAFPNLSVLAAGILQKPVAILSPGEPDLPGMGGLLAAGGAIEQIGIFQKRIWGPLDGQTTRRRLETFIRATGARHVLRGQVYGQIGGRSIGMLTGVASSAIDWHRIFGVDMDHVDQSEILRLAETVSDQERERIVRWLEDNLGKVHYAEGSKLTRDTLKQQIACAAAVKKIITDHEFDFVGIKCHYDMSEYYCTQCLSAAFLPNDLDWDGEREPLACACEADGDGAITMQILKLISGLPPLFLDLRHYDGSNKRWTLCNCGGQSPYYSKRSKDPRENLKDVDLVPVIPKYGGTGAHVRYIGDPGELTCARIMHDSQGMALMAFKAEAEQAQLEWLEGSCPEWPHLFVRIDADPQDVLQELHANHIHAAGGDWMAELELFARLTGIRFVTV